MINDYILSGLVVAGEGVVALTQDGQFRAFGFFDFKTLQFVLGRTSPLPTRRLPYAAMAVMPDGTGARALGRRMREAGIFDADPDFFHLFTSQAGQGIARHVDQDFVGEVVAVLTLGSSRVYEMARARRRDASGFDLGARKDASARVLLLPGDLYVISGRARHRWEHGVPSVKEDQFGGRVYPRSDGCSATWGCVVRDAPEISQYTQSKASEPRQ